MSHAVCLGETLSCHSTYYPVRTHLTVAGIGLGVQMFRYLVGPDTGFQQVLSIFGAI